MFALLLEEKINSARKAGMDCKAADCMRRREDKPAADMVHPARKMSDCRDRSREDIDPACSDRSFFGVKEAQAFAPVCRALYCESQRVWQSLKWAEVPILRRRGAW